jgi:hypothetical protein
MCIYIYILRERKRQRLLQYLQLPETKILAMFRGIVFNFCGISELLCIYPTISLGTPDSVLWNPV